MVGFGRTLFRVVGGAVAVVAVIAITYPMWAPLPTSPNGVVLDGQRKRVPGLRLHLMDSEGQSVEVTTDKYGRFEVPAHYFKHPDTIPELRFVAFRRDSGSRPRFRYEVKGPRMPAPWP